MSDFDTTINNLIKKAQDDIKLAEQINKKQNKLIKKYPRYKQFSVTKLRELGFQSAPLTSDSDVKNYKEVRAKKEILIKTVKEYISNFEKNTNNKKAELIKKIKEITNDPTVVMFKKQIKNDFNDLFIEYEKLTGKTARKKGQKKIKYYIPNKMSYQLPSGMGVDLRSFKTYWENKGYTVIERKEKSEETKEKKEKKEKFFDVKKEDKPKEDKPKEKKLKKKLIIKEDKPKKEKKEKKVVNMEDYRSVLDKLNCLSKYPVKMLNEFRLLHLPNVKQWYKMNKGNKVKLLKEVLKNCDDLPPVPERVYAKSKYGVKYGKVQKYSEQEQKDFIKEGYSTSHPLKQKKLDPVKNKEAYEADIKIVLNKHQKDFVVNFINSYFTGGLLFHGVGSGKTLTSVVFSHYYLTLYPENNVVIISPPSLLFNFVDGLRLFGLDVKDNRYTFETYDKFLKNYKNIVNDKTLLIIDEAHIMRTYISEKDAPIKDEQGNEIGTEAKITSGRKPKILIEACNMCNKILCMTGTAFVNGLYDIENIMAMIGQKEKPLPPSTFDLIVNDPELRYDYFKYKISYFSVFDNPELKKFFPKVNEIFVGFELKDGYDDIFSSIIQGENPYNEDGTYKKELFTKEKKTVEDAFEYQADDREMPEMDMFGKLGFNILKYETKDKKTKEVSSGLAAEAQLKAFYVAQRQYGNVIGGLKVNFILNKIKENPKMKSIVYSSFMRSSITLLKALLSKNGIQYVSITGDDSTTKRAKAKDVYNDPNSGINVLIISKAGTEGVDTKNTQQFFLYEPQFNEASAEQAIARAVRFKSHISLPENQRFVNVYRLMVYLPDDKEKFEEIKDGIKPLTQKEQTDKRDTMNRFLDKVFRKIQKNKTYDTKSETFKAFYNQNNQYEPHMTLDTFNINNSIDNMRTDYARRYVEYILNTFGNTKGLKAETEEYENIKLNNTARGKSADIVLQQISMNKVAEINEFLEILKKDIPKIKDFKEPYHLELIKALDNDEDPQKIIEKQQEILSKNNDKIIKLTSKLEGFIGEEMIRDKEKKTKGTKDKTDKKGQEYFTPIDVANDLINYSTKIKEKDYIRVLEPTAGYGSLVNAFIRKRKQIDETGELNNSYFIDMAEINPKNRQVLKEIVKLNPSQMSLFETPNYLELRPSNDYDLILLNPPFNIRKEDSGLDKSIYDNHFIMKAFEELESGGELLAIVSPTFKTGHNRKELKKWIEEHKIDVLRKYNNYKWKGEKGGLLNLSFDIIRMTKPKLENIIIEEKKEEPKKEEPKKEEPKKEEPKKDINEVVPKELQNAIKQYISDQTALSENEPVPFMPTDAYEDLYVMYLLEKNKNDCYLKPKLKVNIKNNKLQKINIKDFVKNYVKCKKNNKIMVVMLTLSTDDFAHANMLIFNTERNELERFEPHGVATLTEGKNKENLNSETANTEIINKIVKPMNKILKKVDMKELAFVPPNEVCPKGYNGFQEWESLEPQKSGVHKDLNVEIIDQEGYCMAWSLFYGDMRIKFPKLSADKLVEISMKEITTNPTKLRAFIRGITKFYYDRMKEILNIEELKIIYNEDDDNDDVITAMNTQEITRKINNYLENKRQEYGKD